MKIISIPSSPTNHLKMKIYRRTF